MRKKEPIRKSKKGSWDIKGVPVRGYWVKRCAVCKHQRKLVVIPMKGKYSSTVVACPSCGAKAFETVHVSK